VNEAIVSQSHVGLLYEDGAFARVLEPGKHKLRRGLFDKVERTLSLVDMRERSLTIKGQEILTQDKVAIRVSLLVYFRVKDAQAAVHNVASYEDRIYEDVQLAARRFLAGRDLDAILGDRNEISDAVRDTVQETAAGYGVEILRADVKDLVFPGNLREIMNQVLETERRAEAKLIQAKKEIESERLRAEALVESTRRRLEAQREEVQLQGEAERARLEAEQERQQLKLEAELREAQAAVDSPALMKLRELKTLEEMARSGARFVVGLDRSAVGKALSSDDA
jgi:regulator of protease activity HflC (stomatin/prohibitin superfamily)